MYHFIYDSSILLNNSHNCNIQENLEELSRKLQTKLTTKRFLNEIVSNNLKIIKEGHKELCEIVWRNLTRT